MCTHTRLVRNRYTGKSLRVSCGKCRACRQQKAAARAQRIRNNYCVGDVQLFITLTYSPDFLPYVRRSDMCDGAFDIPVYRRKMVRCYRDKSFVSDCGLFDYVYIDPVDQVFHDVPHPRGGDSDQIGICYYPDLQNFIKRLRQTLQRNYDYHKSFSYWACSEYGSITKRPHFHLLLSVPSDDVETFRAAVVKSWPYADKHRTSDYIEVARDVSSYIASYVNKSANAPSFLQTPGTRQTHSCSQDYGVRRKCFTLREILSKIERGDLCYRVPSIVDGVSVLSSLPIPEYVISRYFPKFKGYSLFTDNEIRQLLFRTSELRMCVGHRDLRFKWSDDDYHKFYIRLLNIRKKFLAIGWSLQDFEAKYPLFYTAVWSCLSSVKLKLSYRQVDNLDKWFYYYENANEYVSGFVSSSSLDEIVANGCFSIDDFEIDPNKRLDIVLSSSRLESVYFKQSSCKDVVNLAMSDTGHFV